MVAAANSETDEVLKCGPHQLVLPDTPFQLSDLRRTIQETSRALAFLDVVRLEEMAVCCQKLVSDLASSDPSMLRFQARNASPDMAVFARVLDATRANLETMRRLRDLRDGHTDYDAGSRDGHH